VVKRRLITGVILGLGFAAIILMLPTAWFGAALLVFVLLGAWEWGRLLGLSRPLGQSIYCAMVLGLIILVGLLLESWILLQVVLLSVGAYWGYVIIWLRRYATNPQVRDPALSWELSGFMILVAPWLALVGLHSAPAFGPGYVLFLVALIGVADGSAYFAGRCWGRRKLAPQISPGKTWEGVYGALATALVFSIGSAALLGLRVAQWPVFIGICMITVLFSIVGDLFESMVKRQHDTKDSGSLLPGHGGMLDRMDSLTAAAPIFFLGLQGLPA